VQGRALRPNEQKQGKQPMNQGSQLSLLHRSATDWSPAPRQGENAGIRKTGAYGIVRQPIYASIVVMEVGYIATHPTMGNLILGLTGAASLVARIYFEERPLSETTENEKYMNSVRYRLIPGIS
jgi:protein-S-isoprenylcysteine O-methyltransferase Ste14